MLDVKLTSVLWVNCTVLCRSFSKFRIYSAHLQTVTTKKLQFSSATLFATYLRRIKESFKYSQKKLAEYVLLKAIYSCSEFCNFVSYYFRNSAFARHPVYMTLCLPPKFCISFLFNFSWVLKSSQEKLKTMLKQNVGGANKRYYGACGVEWSFYLVKNKT